MPSVELSHLVSWLPQNEHLHSFTCSRSCIGEGNGTPLQYSCLENPMDGGAWWAAVHEVAKSRTRLSDFTFTFHFHALEKEMATHSSVLAWRIPGMGRRKWQPTPGFLPGESQGRGSLVVCRLWGRIESDTTEAVQQQQQQILYLLWCFSWGISLVFVLGKVFFFSKSAWLISVTFGGGFLLQSLLKIQIKFTHSEVERGKSSITNWWLGCYLCYAFKEF